MFTSISNDESLPRLFSLTLISSSIAGGPRCGGRGLETCELSYSGDSLKIIRFNVCYLYISDIFEHTK